MVGTLYYNGFCKAVDIKEGVVIKSHMLAFNWLEKAADKGGIEGLAYVGYMYVHGLGVTKSSTTGVAFTVMAAEGGSDMACCELESSAGLGGLSVRSLSFHKDLFVFG
eukprot:scaffold57770_cov63-Attheya_sp.AAC.5